MKSTLCEFLDIAETDEFLQEEDESTIIDYLEEDDDIISNNHTINTIEYNSNLPSIKEETINSNKEKSELKDEDVKSIVQEKLLKDYDFARENIIKIIKEGMNLMPELTSLAIELQNPESYDSVARYTQNLVSANEKLIGLSEKILKPHQTNKKEAKQVVNVNTQNNNQPDNVTNNIVNNTVNNTVVLSKRDLIKQLMEENKKQKAIVDSLTIASD